MYIFVRQEKHSLETNASSWISASIQLWVEKDAPAGPAWDNQTSSLLPAGFSIIPIHRFPSQFRLLALPSYCLISKKTFPLKSDPLVSCYFNPSIVHIHSLFLSQECDFSYSNLALFFSSCGFLCTKESFFFFFQRRLNDQKNPKINWI